MDQYYHSLSVSASRMVSNECPVIGKQVMVIVMTQQVTIVTVQSLKDTLNFSFKCS